MARGRACAPRRSSRSRRPARPAARSSRAPRGSATWRLPRSSLRRRSPTSPPPRAVAAGAVRACPLARPSPERARRAVPRAWRARARSRDDRTAAPRRLASRRAFRRARGPSAALSRRCPQVGRARRTPASRAPPADSLPGACACSRDVRADGMAGTVGASAGRVTATPLSSGGSRTVGASRGRVTATLTAGGGLRPPAGPGSRGGGVLSAASSASRIGSSGATGVRSGDDASIAKSGTNCAVFAASGDIHSASALSSVPPMSLVSAAAVGAAGVAAGATGVGAVGAADSGRTRSGRSRRGRGRRIAAAGIAERWRRRQGRGGRRRLGRGGRRRRGRGGRRRRGRGGRRRLLLQESELGEAAGELPYPVRGELDPVGRRRPRNHLADRLSGELQRELVLEIVEAELGSRSRIVHVDARHPIRFHGRCNQILAESGARLVHRRPSLQVTIGFEQHSREGGGGGRACPLRSRLARAELRTVRSAEPNVVWRSG